VENTRDEVDEEERRCHLGKQRQLQQLKQPTARSDSDCAQAADKRRHKQRGDRQRLGSEKPVKR
jgi:hypothetical protein